MSYRAYVATQLWLYLLLLVVPLPPGFFIGAMYWVFWLNRRRVWLWAEGRDDHGRFARGYSSRVRFSA
jgi:hypothetical protein